MIGPMSGATREQADAALGAIEAAGIRPLAVYLHGSAVDGGLRADSDLDLFVLVDAALSEDQRDALVAGLVPISRRGLRPASWRPLELTVVRADAMRPWRYPPPLELQYGEWMRSAFEAGERAPWPSVSPDLAVAVTMVRQSGRALIGPPPGQLLDDVPRRDLMRSMTDALPSLLDDLEDDTRNVLLTLARMWVTAATGRIVPKDAAAEWAARRMPAELGAVLRRAGALYLDGGFGPWEDEGAVRRAARHLDLEVRRAVATGAGA
jgi:streptomycin 3"-adenylyltransferase